MSDYPPQPGICRIDIIVCCDRCNTTATLRDVPNPITARSYLMREGWTKRGKKSTERWRCADCSPVKREEGS